MNKKTSNKIISVALSLFILMTSAPISAFAAEIYSQEKLAEAYKAGKFGKPTEYVKFARVQAEQAKAGQSITTVLKDGTVETKNVAKAGDWIVTNPGGEKYIVPGEKFAKKYEAVKGSKGLFKPTGGVQEFVKISKDMDVLASWGEKQELRAGAYLNVTNMGDVYGVAADEFAETYAKPANLYKRYAGSLKKLALKIELSLQKRIPGYSGVFFRRVLANDVDFMLSKFDRAVAKKTAAKTSSKAAQKGSRLSRVCKRGGGAAGVLVFLGLTAWGVADATAATTDANNFSDIVAQQAVSKKVQARIAAFEQTLSPSEKKTWDELGLFIATVLDEKQQKEMFNDGELLAQMTSISQRIDSDDKQINSLMNKAIMSFKDFNPVDTDEFIRQITNGLK